MSLFAITIMYATAEHVGVSAAAILLSCNYVDTVSSSSLCSLHTVDCWTTADTSGTAIPSRGNARAARTRMHCSTVTV